MCLYSQCNDDYIMMYLLTDDDDDDVYWVSARVLYSQRNNDYVVYLLADDGDDDDDDDDVYWVSARVLYSQGNNDYVVHLLADDGDDDVFHEAKKSRCWSESPFCQAVKAFLLQVSSFSRFTDYSNLCTEEFPQPTEQVSVLHLHNWDDIAQHQE